MDQQLETLYRQLQQAADAEEQDEIVVAALRAGVSPQAISQALDEIEFYKQMQFRPQQKQSWRKWFAWLGGYPWRHIR